jgi:hypothetical protein
MIALGLLGGGISGECRDSLRVSVASQVEALEDLICVSGISSMKELLDVDSKLNGIAGRAST